MTDTRKPPPFKAQRFYVYTGDIDDPESYEARIIWGDQLRGELEAAKRGIDIRKQQMLLATFWCWAEAVRTGRTQAKLDEWRDQLLDVADADKLDEEAAKRGDIVAGDNNSGDDDDSSELDPT